MIDEKIVSYYKDKLRIGTEKIKEMHYDGAPPESLSNAISCLWDGILRDVFFEVAEKKHFTSKIDTVSVVALGGYGRQTLSPKSDLDIMLLFFEGGDPLINFNQEILHILWDIGFDLGYSIRSTKDCEEMAQNDFKSMTSLLESRFLLGNEKFFKQFISNFRKKIINRRIDAFLREKILDRNERYEEVGRIVQVLEPNVKEGAGGLRDVHTIYWISKASGQIETINDLDKIPILSAEEKETLIKSFRFLWKVRNDLHYLSTSKNDVLSIQYQSKIAENLGYKRIGNKPAVEHFLKDYYSSAKSIAQICTLYIRKMLKKRAPSEKREKILHQKKMKNGLILIDNKLYLPRAGELPKFTLLSSLFEVFKYVEHHNVLVSERLRRFIASTVKDIEATPDEMKKSASIFLDILSSKKSITGLLRLMNELGVIGRLIPEFEELDCLVQFDIYHHYTVDEHTFLALEKVDELLTGKTIYDELLYNVCRMIKRIDLLRFAILLHDIGKSGGKGHVERGAEITSKILERLELNEDDAAVVQKLVSNHLLMMHTAEKRDFSDDVVLGNFADAVENEEELRMLLILTYSDISSVSPHSWNDWRKELIKTLYIKTSKFFERGLHKKIVHDEENRRKMQKVIGKVIQKSGGTITEEEVKTFLSKLPQRYSFSTFASRIYTHYLLLNELKKENKVLTWKALQNDKAGITDFLVCFEGKVGSFSNLCGVVSSKGIAILGAQIFTNEEGYAVDTLQCTFINGKPVDDDEVWEEVCRDLQDVFVGRTKIETILSRKKRYITDGKFDIVKVEDVVEIDNDSSETDTIIEVQAKDRLGLLYDITKVLALMNLDIRLARTITEGIRAVLVFYVGDEKGRKIRDELFLEKLRDNLKESLVEK
ncbi:MAG: [protein-PII] uridylyltransferase [Candidatus Schekmanbacteria bacterium]|nr:MAG: [protein-PII] uridylyltransferase [Candidatus Schekmanbacteria bacterium]